MRRSQSLPRPAAGAAHRDRHAHGGDLRHRRRRACARMATGSDDKTVRIWSLPDGGWSGRSACRSAGATAARSLRPRFRRTGDGSRPGDGTRLGKDAHYEPDLFDLQTGASAPLRRVRRCDRQSPAFPPDGRRLAVGTRRQAASRVLRHRDRRANCSPIAIMATAHLRPRLRAGRFACIAVER